MRKDSSNKPGKIKLPNMMKNWDILHGKRDSDKFMCDT